MMKHTLSTRCLTLLVLTLTCAAVAQDAPSPIAPAFEPPNTLVVLDRFTRHVESLDLTSESRTRVQQILARAQASPDARADALIESLNVIYPEFKQAQIQLAGPQAPQAMTTLTALAGSDDPYLAAHARFFAARTLAMDERYERALPMLEKLTADELAHTQESGEAMFLKGVAQVELLQRENALQTLKDFAKNYPFESERMVIGALHMIDELSYLQEGTLSDVTDRMDYSRRRLALTESGSRTQDEQENIVAMLDTLIEQAEQQEQQQQGSGSGQGQGQGGQPGNGGAPSGNQQPNNPASHSAATPGEARMGALHRVNRGSEDDDWGAARDREREEVLNAIKARYPERYKELVEQYYRSLQEDNR